MRSDLIPCAVFLGADLYRQPPLAGISHVFSKRAPMIAALS